MGKLAILFFVAPTWAMFDAVFPLMSSPSECAHGCALWSDLAADGNTRDQSDVNAKWLAGAPPSDAGRSCAMPANDPGDTYWCYCRNVDSTAWGLCHAPLHSTPTQINLQVASPTTIIAAFVTFEEPGTVPAPVARLGKKADLSDAKHIAGVHRMYTETGADHRVYTMSFVRFTDLEPRTKYFYSVSAGTPGSDFSETRSFLSLYGQSSAPTRFAIFGDMGVYSYNNMDRLEADAKARDIDFIVHLGDHAYNIADDDGYRGDGYMDAFSHVISTTPWIPVLGNHEYYDGDEFQRYTDMVMGGVNQSEIVNTGSPPSLRRRAQAKVSGAGTRLNAALTLGQAFGPAAHGEGGVSGPLPSGVASNTSRYYSVDVGLVHFVALDMNAYYFDTEACYIKPQLDWLAADLKAASANRKAVPWIVVMAHHPMYCSSITLNPTVHLDGDDDRDKLGTFQGCTGTGEQTVNQTRVDLEPLFMQYGVDAFFAGHEHDYESIYPSFAGHLVQRSFTNPRATTHFVTGAGGAPGLDKFGDPGPWTRLQIAAWGYGRVTVPNATHFVYEHILNSNHSVVDRVTIVTDKHGPFPVPAPSQRS